MPPNESVATGNAGEMMEADFLDSTNVPLAQTRGTLQTALLPTALFDEAADYAFAICETRRLKQGSKGARLMAARMFLGMKGWSLSESNRALSDALLAVCAGTEAKPALAASLERRFRAVAEPPEGAALLGETP